MKRIKYVKGIRVYPHFENFSLYPYDYMYAEIFSTLLRNEKIISPHYDEIYISIDKTMEDARRIYSMGEKWFKYTFSVLDLEKYQTKNEKEKDQIVFGAICAGLRLITNEDNLDALKIEKVISKIAESGVETELT